MFKTKDKIFIQQWLRLKPYDTHCATDNYYLKIGNEVKKAILNDENSALLKRHLENEEINLLSCFLTSYLEDLVSETNIWNAFVSHHKELYNKALPFYKLDDYYPGEINTQDVRFLIWYFINTVQKATFIAPLNDFILETAENVMGVFEEAWEYAPENKVLKSSYNIDENETNFYIARNLIDTILFKTYLFWPDTFLDLRDSEYELLNENNDNENTLSYLNENRDYKLFTECTRLLSLKGKDWVSKVLGENHKLSKNFPEISQKIRGYFFYKGQDEHDVFIEHIASGKKFKLTKKSFDHFETLKVIDSIMFIGMTRWQEEWWFSGIYFTKEYNADLVLEEKNSLKSQMSVDFLDHQEGVIEEILKKHIEAFLDFTNGSQIVFLEEERVDEFIKGFTDHINKFQNHPTKKSAKANDRRNANGIYGTKDKNLHPKGDSESAIVFFNPKSGAEIGFGINSAFPETNNPYFNPEESEEDMLSLLLDDSFSKELVHWCIENYKSQLSFFKQKKWVVYLDNIDFLLRFYKKNQYSTNPSVSISKNDSIMD